MHRNEIIYALICINNYVLLCLISMLSLSSTVKFFLSLSPLSLHPSLSLVGRKKNKFFPHPTVLPSTVKFFVSPPPPSLSPCIPPSLPPYLSSSLSLSLSISLSLSLPSSLSLDGWEKNTFFLPPLRYLPPLNFLSLPLPKLKEKSFGDRGSENQN